jgi:hypothetical protein
VTALRLLDRVGGRPVDGRVRRLLPWLATALLALVVLCAFLPWVRTGEASRSSFRLLRDLNTLGVLRSGADRAGRVVWVLLPCLAAVAALAVALGRPRLGAWLAALVSTIGLAGAVVVANSPLATLIGARAMLVVAPLSLACSVLAALAQRPAPRPPVPPTAPAGPATRR